MADTEVPNALEQLLGEAAQEFEGSCARASSPAWKMVPGLMAAKTKMEHDALLLLRLQIPAAVY